MKSFILKEHRLNIFESIEIFSVKAIAKNAKFQPENSKLKLCVHFIIFLLELLQSQAQEAACRQPCLVLHS